MPTEIKRNLIAFYSPAPQSGKSTAARALMAAHGFQPVSFADPIKHTCETFLLYAGVDYHDAHDSIYGGGKDKPVEVLSGCTGRDVQIALGQGMRQLKADFWVKIATAKIEQHRARGMPVVVDDLRLPNEYAALKAMGATLVHLVRPGYEAPEDSATEGRLTGMEFDFMILNGTTVQDLQDQVKALVRYP